MEKFAFMIHPLSAKRDVARKYPIAKLLPESVVEWAIKFKSPMEVSHITGVKSITGVEAEGWLVGCPLTAKQLLNLPYEVVLERLVKTVKIAEDLGAKIIGLGAFTSVAGDAGVSLSKRVGIAVTTGNSYTIATAIEGALPAAEKMGIDSASARIAVVGATGSIGKTCAQILCKSAASMMLVARAKDRLDALAAELSPIAKGTVTVSTDVESGIKDADIVIAVSSAADTIIEPQFIKSGAVVCDVARPRDVSERVTKERNDVLVIDGGVVQPPGDVDFHFNFGFPPRTAYACMSETMMLALDGRYESFSLGKDISAEQVEATQQMAKKHGFKLAGFRSFEKAVTEEKIAEIRKNAGR